MFSIHKGLDIKIKVLYDDDDETYENKSDGRRVKCLKNLETRTTAKNVTIEIEFFSKIYNIYKYKKYPHIVLNINSPLSKKLLE